MNRLIIINLKTDTLNNKISLGQNNLFYPPTFSGPFGPFSGKQLILMEITEFVTVIHLHQLAFYTLQKKLLASMYVYLLPNGRNMRHM
jgi:hypothetical protein